MKKLTIRLTDTIYDRLYLLASTQKTSVNRIVGAILEKYMNDLKDNNKGLNDIYNMLEKISKRQYKHFKLSQQHFANFGYLSNADINEDKCLKEIMSSKDTFNE